MADPTPAALTPQLPTVNLKELERAAILQAIAENPERQLAARRLGISRFALRRRIKRLWPEGSVRVDG